jgi:hypothetical protein
VDWQKIDVYIPYENELLRDAVKGTLAKHGRVSGVEVSGNEWNVFGWVPGNDPRVASGFVRSAKICGFKVFFPPSGGTPSFNSNLTVGR